ncbi:MAG TPA: pyrroline-5-carboxylate reductase [Candidatus Gastranaerophilaceae bacterium]|nr:pyrroline-5-carboxylate reductase [Candidatus Gastranaerophilaceae bacterium]HPT40918.1 pyrroline-5-carboxylate reductase [Candidatus Gastranaerophilaceae bacterium]
MNKIFNQAELKVGFIGCGKMANAMIKGVLSSGFLGSDNIIASEISQGLASVKKSELGINILLDNCEVARICDVIFLAIKPHFIKEVLQEIKEELQGKLVVSIAAGVKTKSIEDQIGEVAVIRVMPNAPAVIKEGMSGIVKGNFADEDDVNFVKEFMSNIGKCIVVEEAQIDVLTAISGSGPAFFYKIIHEMALAGEKLGLDYEKSKFLAIQTAIGSAKLMQSSNLNAQDMINMVATKGGCTEVGVEYMNEINTKELFFELIKRTAKKSKELG